MFLHHDLKNPVKNETSRSKKNITLELEEESSEE
jgi:hypothetical protein